jgi:hypothetical protein
MQQVDQSSKVMLGIVGTLLLGAAIWLVASQLESSHDELDLQVALGQLHSYAGEAIKLLDEDTAGHLTGPFFRCETQLLQQNAAEVRMMLAEHPPQQGAAHVYGPAQEAAAAAEQLLGELPSRRQSRTAAWDAAARLSDISARTEALRAGLVH